MILSGQVRLCLLAELPLVALPAEDRYLADPRTEATNAHREAGSGPHSVQLTPASVSVWAGAAICGRLPGLSGWLTTRTGHAAAEGSCSCRPGLDPPDIVDHGPHLAGASPVTERKQDRDPRHMTRRVVLAVPASHARPRRCAMWSRSASGRARTGGRAALAPLFRTPGRGPRRPGPHR